MIDARRMRGWVLAAALGGVASSVGYADSSYQETTQITGGALMDTMKSLSFMSKQMKQAFAPVSTLTMVHGNQKAVVSKESTEIIDLDKEEMIHIDNVKKTYYVVTFAQMRQAAEQLPEKMQQAQVQQEQQPQQPKPNIKTSFTVDVKNTGASKEINGLMAQEQIVTLTMTVTNLDAPANGPNGQTNTGSFVVTNDAWIAPDPPQVQEIADFDKRMAEKMMEGVDAQAILSQLKGSSPQMTQMLAGRPGSEEAMQQMGKEMEKLKGTHVMETVSMGALAPAGTGQSASGSQNSAQGPQESSGQVAGQVAGDTAAQTAAGESSMHGGIVGSALGSSIMGAWHHKKSSQNNTANNNTNTTNANSNTNANAGTTPQASGAGPASTAPGNASGNASAQGMQTVVLMSMTSQKSNFSGEAVPASVFAVPAGYADVTSTMTAPLTPTGAGAASH